MSFETDKQTLDDLNILGKYSSNSVYSLFGGLVTRGAERLMDQMFTHPLTDAEEINRRTAIFRYFKTHALEFPGDSEELEEIDQYIGNAGRTSWFVNLLLLCKMKSLELISKDEHFGIWRAGMEATIHFLRESKAFLERVNEDIAGNPLEERVKWGLDLLNNKAFARLLEDTTRPLSFGQMFSVDRLLRSVWLKPLQELLGLFCEIDLYIVVGRVAREYDFCFAEAMKEGEVSIEIKGLHHPCIRKAVANDLSITRQKNIFFLTGANMAGKSTLMKSFGIAVYMAHMGFPVAAREMRFTVQDGMYTSINVPDNINMGYSHFYAEVLRVKKVAIEVSLSKRLVVIFDELFKGTNVKDAYDATYAVTSALAKRHACSFMISTHIIEVGHELGKNCDNATFAYLPTVMNGSVPTYTYKLEPGITNDKHGMIIINNERIVELIREVK
ncbi:MULTISPECIES: MutS-related protein [Butyricimonas]|uniref:MutS-related protein n=1 Tax=Butyricimonas TaxID=574697 RepID=UPI001D097075|nr:MULTISPECIES: hypothetical protein [Butyricimonas]MCB6973878.1 hypothetical protein [Butyricimonas synergistica]MCG4520779.1 hypothetical protein [Butyricimonas sp. DFI.6.44]